MLIGGMIVISVSIKHAPYATTSSDVSLIIAVLCQIWKWIASTAPSYTTESSATKAVVRGALMMIIGGDVVVAGIIVKRLWQQKL
jgi:hypothetical protein